MKPLLSLAALGAAIVASSAQAGEAACGLSLAAAYTPTSTPISEPQGRSRSLQQLRIDLANSQYRVGDAPWRSTSALCDAERLDLVPGESAAVACRTDVACGDYSFLFRVEVLSFAGEVLESRLIPFPTQVSSITVQRARSVNLGDLRALLDEQSPQTNPRRAARDH